MNGSRVFGCLIAVFPAAIGWYGGDARGAMAAVGGDDGQGLRRTPVVEAYERAKDSVVNISTTRKVRVKSFRADFFGLFSVPVERNELSVGSGFVIHEDGYIATNAHVVARGAELRVTFADGRAYDARIVARETRRDLAVIKIEPDAPLKPIPLGRSDDLMIGEQSIAIGNPVGLQNTLTTGVVSALHRELDIGGNVVYRNLIQTDASINPGNSGGPLLNVLGELIGINTAIRTDAQNIGFAIPVDQLRALLPDILDTEKLNKLQLGMRVRGQGSVRVVEVRADSPADKAGVELGDAVQAVDGTPLQGEIDFLVEMLGHTAGDKVVLDLVRDGRRNRAIVTLTALPRPDGEQLALERLGVRVADMSARIARDFGMQRRSGVVVVGVEPRGPADHTGIRPGDLLMYLGNFSIHDVDHLGALLSEVATGDAIDVGVLRADRRGWLSSLQGRLYAR